MGGIQLSRPHITESRWFASSVRKRPTSVQIRIVLCIIKTMDLVIFRLKKNYFLPFLWVLYGSASLGVRGALYSGWLLLGEFLSMDPMG